MKTKVYRSNKLVCRAYLKPVGQGYETGFVFNGVPIFLGNFIHRAEATRWWSLMNRELRILSRKFALGQIPVAWCKHLIRDHLNKCYYGFIDRVVVRHQRQASRALLQDIRAFKRIRSREVRRHGNGMRRVPLLKVA
jgi:hypothetical protein